jgi:hypothetical protein
MRQSDKMPAEKLPTEISFSPSPDVTVMLNALLDKLENRSRQDIESESGNPQRRSYPVRIPLAEIDLPGYFSQIDPEPRILANQQFRELQKHGLATLTWLPGETEHLLDAVSLSTQSASGQIAQGQLAALYNLLKREPLASRRAYLETLLLADQFRFPADDWRARAVRYILHQIRAGKSVSPFSLADSTWNLDLLSILAALPDLKVETPYRVFSVQVFNDSKRFDILKLALIRLARLANPQWKKLSADELLGELNLVANPTYLHLFGNWQFTTASGEVLSLGGFSPAVGFPAIQAASIQAVSIYAGAVLCIENLTAFHEFVRNREVFQSGAAYQEGVLPDVAVLCIMGNPSPAIRHVLSLVPEQIPIYLWADLDYGGFNILSQLRRHVSRRIQPYRMDIATFDVKAHLSRPLTQQDERNLRQIASRTELEDTQPVVEYLCKRRLKLEQEAFYYKSQLATDAHPFANKTR